MRALQKLVKNGSSTQVTIPRQMLIFCGLITGQAVVIEVLEDKSLHVRIPTESDFAPRRPSLVQFDMPAAVKA